MERVLFPTYTPKHRRLLCVDSDGCAFDTMELKHKECFCPVTILVWGLQAVSKYAREAWEFGNLYSQYRGQSRFHELILMFDWLKERQEVAEYGFTLPDIEPLRHWVQNAPVLNNQALKELSDDPVMKRTLEWSLECNRRIAEMVHDVPPFPGVREAFELLANEADIVIVSATAREALQKEWGEHGLMPYVHLLCAQEDGSKKECIRALLGHYNKEDIMMVGDAPGDQHAAQANDVLFYPIVPGKEIASWRLFRQEAVGRFLQHQYQGDYQSRLIDAYAQSLADTPPWTQ